jgi:cytochrome c oxidase subunit 4
MSASTPAASAGHHDDHDVSKFQIYVQIALLLAIITGIEIVAVFLPFEKWILITSLVVLSLVKFMYVIFYFMHLRWDKPFCTILFFIGLILASGTVWALLAIFGAEASRPLPV